MAIESHLAELEKRHQALEHEISEALTHLSTDDLTLVELKRRKLLCEGRDRPIAARQSRPLIGISRALSSRSSPRRRGPGILFSIRCTRWLPR